MELDIIQTKTTWNDAAGSINSNYAKIADAIAQLKANGGGGGGGADIDLTDYATKVWVKNEALSPYAKSSDLSAYLPIEGGTMEGPLTMASELLMDAHIHPTTTNYYDIGSSELKFNRIYANYFYGNLSGTATSATTASRLSVGGIFPTTKYGNYAGILQTSGTTNATVPQEGVMFNILRIFRNVSTGYYTDLAQSLDGEEGLYYRRMQAGTLSEWKRVACEDDLKGYLLKDVADTTYLGIEATAADAGKLGGQLPSYYAKSDDLTALSNLFKKMFEFDSENNAIKAKLSLYSVGGITAGGVGSAGGGGTSGGGGISEITSEMVVSALGYTPYNASNPSGYITASALNPYALKSEIPTSLPASDVYDWAKASVKPTYSASEVGALGIYKADADTNLDTLQSAGVYSLGASGNTPARGYANLFVAKGGRNTFFQLLGNYQDNNLYYRGSDGNKFTEWQSIAFTSQIPTLLSQLTDNVGYLLKDVADTTYLGIKATAADAGKLGGQLPSYYAKSDDLTTLSNLFKKMFEFDSENNAIKAKLSLYSVGGITAGGVGSAGGGGTSGGGGISEITSEMVVSALGYTPYNASNPSGYITVSALSEYALKSNIPTALSQLTNDAYYLRGYNTTETSFTDNRTIGVYRYGSGVANKDGAPAGATDYGNLVVFRGDIANTLVQLYFNYNDDKIFVRSTNSEGIKNNTKGWQTLAYVSNIPTDNSQLNNGAGYSTKSWVNDKLVAYTPLTTVQGYDSRITGLEGALPDLQNRVTVVEQLAQGTDAALINYALKTEIPTLANSYGRGGVLHSTDNGYAEVGIALDFHRLAGDNEDYWTRLCVADTLAKNTVYLPTVNGTLAVTSQIPTLLSQLTDNVGYATQGWVEGKGYVTLAGDQTISGVKRFTASMFAAKLNFTGGTTTATLEMDGSSLSINQELKLTKGGSSDICSGIATAFKTNLAQTTNLIANKIIMGTNSGQASTLPIQFCKYTSISDTAPSGLTTLMSLDTNGNLDVKSLTIGGITLSVVNGALKIAGSAYTTGAFTVGA